MELISCKPLQPDPTRTYCGTIPWARSVHCDTGVGLSQGVEKRVAFSRNRLRNCHEASVRAARRLKACHGQCSRDHEREHGRKRLKFCSGKEPVIMENEQARDECLSRCSPAHPRSYCQATNNVLDLESHHSVCAHEAVRYEGRGCGCR